jgi:hypothetical protein
VTTPTTPGEPDATGETAPGNVDAITPPPTWSAGSSGGFVRYDAPWPPEAARPPEAPRPRRHRWWFKSLVALATAAVIAALGLPLGALWSALAPWLPGIKQSDGVYLADVEGEQRAAQEGWFIVLSVGSGLVIAIVAYYALRRFRGAFTVTALAIGGAVAGWLAWWFGHNIGRDHALELARTAPIGTLIKFPVDLRIKQPGNVELWHGWFPHVGGVLMYLAIAAVAGYMLISGLSTPPEVKRARAKYPMATPAPYPGAPPAQDASADQNHHPAADPFAAPARLAPPEPDAPAPSQDATVTEG